MNAQHTPGPWAADLGESFCIRERDGGRIALLCFLAGRYGTKGRRDGDEVAATARLIAAAPELLEALEAVISEYYGQVHGPIIHSVKNARAAIAKAKGGDA